MSDAATDAAGERPTGKLAVEARRLIWPGGLSARLLLLTAAFALAAGLLILAPSLASYEEARLVDRIRAAELTTLAVESAPARTVSSNTAARLLRGAGVDTVAVQSGQVRRLLLEAPQMPGTPRLVDLRTRHPSPGCCSPSAPCSAPASAGSGWWPGRSSPTGTSSRWWCPTGR